MSHVRYPRFVGAGEIARRTRSLVPVASAGEIFGPLLGELPVERSGGLADFDHVAVGVLHVAADLRTAIDWRCHELGPL